MRITVDTNVLVRFVTRDDAAQATAADHALMESELVAIPMTAWCELVWVLRRIYKFSAEQIATGLTTLAEVATVKTDRKAFAAGIVALQAGADFADGVIAHVGRNLGGTTFVSFDRKAVALLNDQGLPAREPW